MKYMETVIERKETINENGVKIVNEIVKLKSACTEEFVWYRTTGDHKCIVCSYKTEKRMRKAMAERSKEYENL